MSVQSDAETIRALANKIVEAERLKAELLANASVIYLDEGHEIPVTLTGPQKQAALAVEDGWKQTIKTIAGAW